MARSSSCVLPRAHFSRRTNLRSTGPSRRRDGNAVPGLRPLCLDARQRGEGCDRNAGDVRWSPIDGTPSGRCAHSRVTGHGDPTRTVVSSILRIVPVHDETLLGRSADRVHPDRQDVEAGRLLVRRSDADSERGANGGDATIDAVGGLGGTLEATMVVTPGESLPIIVGGAGFVEGEATGIGTSTRPGEKLAGKPQPGRRRAS